MSRNYDFRADMESYTWDAVDSGMSLKETLAYVRRKMKNIDENYVRKLYREYSE